jgi:Protein of unknown function (DUF2637)
MHTSHPWSSQVDAGWRLRQLEVLPLTNQTYLRRIRMLARLTLVLGVAASIAANVLHARNNPVSQGIAAWPPLALLLTVELVSRVPVHRRGLAVIRIGATTAIAAIAAWVSYWHMAGVTARYGESPASAHLMPLCVDGLVVVASISLVELAGRIRALDAAVAQPQTSPARARARATASTAASSAGTRAAPAKKATRARKAAPGRAAAGARKAAPAKQPAPPVAVAPTDVAAGDQPAQQQLAPAAA